MESELYGEIDSLSRRLEPIMTKLAKACLISKPEDIDQFCYTFFANRIGVEIRDFTRNESAYSAYTNTQDVPSSRGFAADDDLDDDEEAIEADYTAAIIRAKSRKTIVRKTNYESSEDEDEGASPASNVTAETASAPEAGNDDAAIKIPSRSLEALSDDGDGGEDADQFAFSSSENQGRIRSIKEGTLEFLTQQAPEDKLVSAEATARIDALALRARDDPRMKKLFETWDADGGGTVDLVELVVAMHKFNRVMEDGSGLKRASEALLHNDNDESQELDIHEFTRFIVQFCDEAYGKTFNEMATHMLAVAGSSSERAALAKASGNRDVDQIIANDEKEIEVLKETVRGVEASVVENITKIKSSRRVMFQ
jgi:hypothetical protein